MDLTTGNNSTPLANGSKLLRDAAKHNKTFVKVIESDLHNPR